MTAPNNIIVAQETTVRKRRNTGCTISIVELEVLVRGGQQQRGLWIGVGVSAVAGAAGIVAAGLGSDWGAASPWVIGTVAFFLVLLLMVTGMAIHGAIAAKPDAAYTTTVDRIREELEEAEIVPEESSREPPTIEIGDARGSSRLLHEAVQRHAKSQASLRETIESLSADGEKRAKREHRIAPRRRSKKKEGED